MSCFFAVVLPKLRSIFFAANQLANIRIKIVTIRNFKEVVQIIVDILVSEGVPSFESNGYS